MLKALILALYFGVGQGVLFTKGIIHYSVNANDYDPHSQRIIASTLSQLERELCLKFFLTPRDRDLVAGGPRLLVANPARVDNCVPTTGYNFNGSEAEMVVGYKCLTPHDIARITVDMLRASIDRFGNSPVNSYDLAAKYQEKDREPNHLLSRSDRGYINSAYSAECGSLVAGSMVPSRRSQRGGGSDYYNRLVWPLGLVMYGVDPRLRDSLGYNLVKQAMTTLERDSCLVFQYHEPSEGALEPVSMLWFTVDGNDEPHLGFREKNQTINLLSMTRGAPGHTAHTLNNLLRAVGVPMMSNRYDRDNYIKIQWRNVEKGKEYLLEKLPEEAWLENIPYDFDSVTHAPANFACAGCQLGAATVQPIQDLLWQRSLAMGHRATLSRYDIATLQQLYGGECEKRNNAAQ